MATDMKSIIERFKDPRTMKMPLTNTPEFNNPSPQTSFPIQGRPVQTTAFPKLDRSVPHTVNYWPQFGAQDPTGGVPYIGSPMPQKAGVGTSPSVGAYQQYAQTPNTGSDPNRLSPGSLPFVNRPPLDITVRGGNTKTASIPMPQSRPKLNIQPFTNQGNVMDPGNEGYVDPMSAYMPPPAAPQSPAVAAATSAGQAQPPQTSWMQDMITGLNSLVPGYNSPRDMSRAQMYDATNAAAADAARTQNRSGTGTDGYVRDASGQVVGRDPKFAGLTPSQMYDQISGRQPAGRTTFSRDMGLERKLAGTGVSADQYVKGLRDGTYSGLGDVRGRPATPVTAGPTQGPARSIAPVSGGIMAPAQRRRAPIMRSA